MSTSTGNSTTSESPQGSNPSANVTRHPAIASGVDWVAKHWPRIRLGHEGMMLDKIGRQHQMVEDLARATADGNFQRVGESLEGEDMGVNIGDHIHYHVAPDHVAPEQPSRTPASNSPAPSALAKWGKRAALAAAIGSGPIGAGVGYLLSQQQPDSPPAAAAQPPGGYLQYGLKVRPPEGK